MGCSLQQNQLLLLRILGGIGLRSGLIHHAQDSAQHENLEGTVAAIPGSGVRLYPALCRGGRGHGLIADGHGLSVADRRDDDAQDFRRYSPPRVGHRR